jgi:hypothetical protein
MLHVTMPEPFLSEGARGERRAKDLEPLNSLRVHAEKQDPILQNI